LVTRTVAYPRRMSRAAAMSRRAMSVPVKARDELLGAVAWSPTLATLMTGMVVGPDVVVGQAPEG
jgi:hypothetical protein